jgi:ABC-2 type transport system permease protein
MAALPAGAAGPTDKGAKGRAQNSPWVLLPQTLVQTKRLLVGWSRDPRTVIETLVVPILLLVTLDTVFGRKISAVSGHDALFGTVPLVAMAATVTGTSISAIGLVRERANGLLARMWVLPVHRASGLLARFFAESVRILVTTVAILCAGLILGFRFHQGVWGALGWLIVPVVVGVAFATIVTAAAFFSATTTLVEAIALVNILAIFFCTGFVPLEQYPEWIQPVVEHQPMSYAIEAMRGLAMGGPIRWPVIGCLLWAAGIVAVCVVPMVVGYRKASMR